MFGEEHALVDDGAAGQRADVEFRDLGGDGGFLDAAADDVEVSLEHVRRAAWGVAHHDLFDFGACLVGFFADHADVYRDLAPAVDLVAEAEDFGLRDLPAAFLGGEVGFRQEHLADRDLAVLGAFAAAFYRFGEEVLRDLDVDAGAVAGLAVGVHGAAVPEGAERVYAGLHDGAAGFAVQGCDQADAAGIVFLGGRVGVFETGYVGVPVSFEIRSHCNFPAEFSRGLGTSARR